MKTITLTYENEKRQTFRFRLNRMLHDETDVYVETKNENGDITEVDFVTFPTMEAARSRITHKMAGLYARRVH